ncbi:MAG: hypothetical protein MUO97_10870 [Dehalococcoidia bacterium]|nr:hypothetical protein [Dehalococcoidia bacterium]
MSNSTGSSKGGFGSFGDIIAVGIIAILVILIGRWLGLPNNIVTGLILTGVSILLFLVSGAIYSHSWIISVAVGVVALGVLIFALHSFSTPDIAKTEQSLLPTIQLLLL